MGAKVVVTYPYGSLVRFTVKFTDPTRTDAPVDPAPPEGDVANTLVDPTTVTSTLKLPNGSTVTKTYGVDSEVVREGVGIYHIDVSCSAPGNWVHDWTGVGALQAEAQTAFAVGPNLLA